MVNGYINKTIIKRRDGNPQKNGELQNLGSENADFAFYKLLTDF